MNKTVDHWIAVADTLKRQRDQAEKERDALRKVIATMEELAREAYAHWDNDADSKVGKCLVALSGAPGLRKDLDRARDAALEVKELGGAKAECEALRKDAARLDWLGKFGVRIDLPRPENSKPVWVVFSDNLTGLNDTYPTANAATIREAIDAAMAVKPQRRE